MLESTKRNVWRMADQWAMQKQSCVLTGTVDPAGMEMQPGIRVVLHLNNVMFALTAIKVVRLIVNFV